MTAGGPSTASVKYAVSRGSMYSPSTYLRRRLDPLNEGLEVVVVGSVGSIALVGDRFRFFTLGLKWFDCVFGFFFVLVFFSEDVLPAQAG